MRERAHIAADLGRVSISTARVDTEHQWTSKRMVTVSAVVSLAPLGLDLNGEVCVPHTLTRARTHAQLSAPPARPRRAGQLGLNAWRLHVRASVCAGARDDKAHGLHVSVSPLLREVRRSARARRARRHPPIKRKETREEMRHALGAFTGTAPNKITSGCADSRASGTGAPRTKRVAEMGIARLTPSGAVRYALDEKWTELDGSELDCTAKDATVGLPWPTTAIIQRRLYYAPRGARCDFFTPLVVLLRASTIEGTHAPYCGCTCRT
jgi:hypothetical protein